MAAGGAGHRRCRAGRVPGALLAAPRLAAPAAPQPRGGGGYAALGCPRRSVQARGSRRRLAAVEPSRAGPPAPYGAPPAGRARMAAGPAGRPQAAAPAPERACSGDSVCGRVPKRGQKALAFFRAGLAVAPALLAGLCAVTERSARLRGGAGRGGRCAQGSAPPLPLAARRAAVHLPEAAERAAA